MVVPVPVIDNPVPVPIYILEKDVQLRLAKDGGQREVSIGGRSIDVLTDKEVIEVKCFKDRLDVLKVLVYCVYYLDKKPRIHLFTRNGEKCQRDPILEKACRKNGINLTYEN